MKIRTYTQLEAILRTAFDVKGNSTKDVAAMANINLNTLYKWNCGAIALLIVPVLNKSLRK